MLFRYGAVVLFDVQPLEQDEFLRQLQPRVQEPAAEHEVEQITVRIDPDAKEVLEGNTVILKDTGTERLEIVADILSKSVCWPAMNRRSPRRSTASSRSPPS